MPVRIRQMFKTRLLTSKRSTKQVVLSSRYSVEHINQPAMPISRSL